MTDHPDTRPGLDALLRWLDGAIAHADEFGVTEVTVHVHMLRLTREALASPATGDSRPECAECQRQERLLGADPTEEWVADEWSRTTEHPHTGDSRPDLRLPEPQPGDFVVGDDGAMFKSEGLEG